MRVRVLAFARVRELLGGGAHELQVSDGATVGDVWDMLSETHSGLSSLAGSTRIARNGRLVRERSERVCDGDELSLLPPVGGG